MKTKILHLANSGAHEPGRYIGLANALAVDADGWALIPFGDSRHSGADARQAAGAAAPQPIIQRFDRPAAEALVNDFKSTWGAIKRAVIGVPIFRGHPDTSRFAHAFPDKSPRGTIADMQVCDAGLRLRPVLTEQGAAELRDGWNEFSPYWLCKVTGRENGMRVLSPFTLKSIGLVPSGNIPGLSLVNADEFFPVNQKTMNPYLQKLLSAMGIKIAADASDGDQSAAVEQATARFAAANAAETEAKTKLGDAEKTRTALEQAKAALEGEKTALANAKTAAEQERDTLKTQVAAERKERAMLLANAAVADGRLPGAERDATVTALCNAADFGAEAAKLAARPLALRTTSRTLILGGQRGTGPSRAAQILELVNARMDAKHEDYAIAYASIQAEPKHAALFAEMQSPQVKTRR